MSNRCCICHLNIKHLHQMVLIIMIDCISCINCLYGNILLQEFYQFYLTRINEKILKQQKCQKQTKETLSDKMNEMRWTNYFKREQDLLSHSYKHNIQKKKSIWTLIPVNLKTKRKFKVLQYNMSFKIPRLGHEWLLIMPHTFLLELVIMLIIISLMKRVYKTK